MLNIFKRRSQIEIQVTDIFANINNKKPVRRLNKEIL